MGLKQVFNLWCFNRDLRLARRRFERLRRSSVYNTFPRLERRGVIKSILRAAGFKKIRLSEKS